MLVLCFAYFFGCDLILFSFLYLYIYFFDNVLIFIHRYQHCETNFREERGMKTLCEAIKEIDLPAVAYLDYAWLQTNYYKEKPQGYGMNWLPKKISNTSWNPGKIQMLFSVSYNTHKIFDLFVRHS